MKEQYQPSQKEINKAEEMMTNEQKEMSEQREKRFEEVRENLTNDFKKMLAGIDNDYMETHCAETIDKQCQDRFGCSWKEIRKQVFEDLESISKWHTPTEWKGGAAESGLHANSGHWMINQLLKLHSFKTALEWDNCQSKFAGNGMDEHTVHDENIRSLNWLINNAIQSNKEIDPNRNIEVAPLLVRDDIEKVLKSHGLSLEEKVHPWAEK